jgi:hypothetical protein
MVLKCDHVITIVVTKRTDDCHACIDGIMGMRKNVTKAKN